tara:strand:- start:19 stop:150 length:132 start_codon:yes stop_codon:yes gene_type:complete
MVFSTLYIEIGFEWFINGYPFSGRFFQINILLKDGYEIKNGKR